MTLGQETRWAYSTMLPSPHGALPVLQLTAAADATTTNQSVHWSS